MFWSAGQNCDDPDDALSFVFGVSQGQKYSGPLVEQCSYECIPESSLAAQGASASWSASTHRAPPGSWAQYCRALTQLRDRPEQQGHPGTTQVFSIQIHCLLRSTYLPLFASFLCFPMSTSFILFDNCTFSSFILSSLQTTPKGWTAKQRAGARGAGTARGALQTEGPTRERQGHDLYKWHHFRREVVFSGISL